MGPVGFCGGTILDSMTVLTAAHCGDSDPEFIKSMFVEAGVTSKHLSKVDGPQGQKVLVDSLNIHPDYRRRK